MYNTPFLQKFNGNHCFFVGDLHYSHTNLCRGTSLWQSKEGTRDFDSIYHMNKAILDSINSTVKEDDMLFHVGDIIFGDKRKIVDLRQAIKCKTVYTAIGNHDHWLIKKPEYWSLFAGVFHYTEIFCSDKTGKYHRVNLFHYPMKSWHDSHKNGYALTGHVHNNLPYENHELGLDVGWDVFKRPISFYEICDLMDKKVWKSVDHHDRKTQ